jgi:hypothetical protein
MCFMIRDSSTLDYDIFADRTRSLVAIMFFKDVYILLATC